MRGLGLRGIGGPLVGLGPQAAAAIPVSYVVAPPSGFGWTPSFTVEYDPDSGLYVSDLDYEAMAPTGTAIYVDTATGLDTNTGADWANALKSIKKALDKLAADTSLHVVYVKAGDYLWAERWKNTSFTQDAAFIAVDGVVRTSPIDDAVSWSKTAGRTNVYESAARQAVQGVSDAAVDSGEGNATCLTAVADVATVDATQGSYYDDGGTVYVHTADSRAADADVSVYGNLAGPIFNTDDQNIYVEGFVFEGCGSACVNITKGGRFVFVDCEFLYPWVNNCLDADGLDEIYMIRCSAGEAVQDGFNYHTCAKVYEDTCLASGSGRGAGNTFNGSTAHDAAAVIRLNGTYRRCWGPNIADANNGTSWCLGTMSRDSRDDTSPANYYTDGNMWLHKCTSILGAATYDYYEAGAGKLYTRACTDEGSYFGTVEEY